MDWNNINTDRDTSGLGPIEYDQAKVPPLVRQYANNVRTKTYGQENRESIARTSEYTGLIASEASSKVDNQDAEIEDLRARFNNAVSAVTVDSEVTDSRVSSDEVFPTLKDRLDNVDGNIKHLSDNTVIVYPNGSDDTQNIQAAFDSLTDGGYLHLVDGKTYKIKSNVTLIQPITIIGHNAMLEYIGAGNDSMITFSSGYSGMRDVRVRKEKTIPGVVAFKFNKTIKGDVKNINFNDNCDFLKAFELFAVYDSNFANIRIKNNLTEYTGTIFEANYCVNNTVTNSVFGFANYGIHLTEVQNPTSMNRNEGVIVNGLTTYYCNYPIHAPNVTMLMIDNSILDFTQKTAINAGNGGGLYVTNTWIQVMHNNNSTAVAISANFKGAKLDGLYIVGNKEHTGSQAFQIANRRLTIVKNIHLLNIKVGVAANVRDVVNLSDDEEIKNGTVGGYMRTSNGGGAGLLATNGQAFAFIYAVDALNINNYVIGWAHLQPGVSPRVRTLSKVNLSFGVSNTAGTQVIDGSTNIVSYAFITPISGINVNVDPF